jgi:DNA polymerase-1
MDSLDTGPEKTLLLVDGSSYLYRAFHAMPDLRNPAGEPTGAIYGVINMLRKLRTDYKASHCACVFDAKGRTFRDDHYEHYKANRAPMPDDLALQIETLHECVRALGWPLLCVEGVEADDVIGTLARDAERRGMRVVISTGDKDLTQLVSARITWVNTMSNEVLDEAGVQAKFGVPADRIVDYLALLGDSIDNIPGVDKVGPKTAVKWVTQYGSLEGVMEHAAEVGGAVGENLRKALDWLPKGRMLLTVKCDCELPLALDDLDCGQRDDARLAQLFEHLGFKTWLKEVQAGNGGVTAGETALTPGARGALREQARGEQARQEQAAGQPARPEPQRLTDRDYALVVDEAALEDWALRLEAAEIASFDTETTGLDPLTAKLVGISVCVEPGRAAYIPLEHRYAGAPAQLGVERVAARLKPWFENAARKKLAQNAKFDQHVLANHGIGVAGLAHDTLLESYVLESNQRHDMDSLAERHLGLKPISYDEMTGKGRARISFDQVDLEHAVLYAGEDADITLRLHHALSPRVSADEQLAFVYGSIELPVSEVLFRMERAGVLIDGRLLESQGHELGQKMLALEDRAYKEAGQRFNLGSPKQLCEIFFERLQMPVLKKTPGGSPSTDEEVLEKLALDYPLPKTILEYRALSKLKSTYTDKLPKMVNPATGRVHTCYGQTTAVTGRLASTEPNLQNIPVRTPEGRRIREAFIAPPGAVIVSADYSQVELRIMAHLSGDEALVAAFERGDDIHRATAAEVFGRALHEVSNEERRYAKAINFGLMYGMSAFGLAQNLGIERATAQAYIASYFARFSGVAKFLETVRVSARERGYVESVFGRRVYLPEIRSSNPARRAGAERQAINAPMQGTAADLIKLAMIRVQAWLDAEKLAARLVMQVHDELVLEVPEGEQARVTAELPGLMTGVAQLRVPLVADLGSGPNWEKAH